MAAAEGVVEATVGIQLIEGGQEGAMSMAYGRLVCVQQWRVKAQLQTLSKCSIN